jgi:2-hydroxy-6-oxonona-2,4-dienedioate hydrolase
MHLRNLIRVLAAGATAATLVAYARYRKEMRSIRDALDRGSTIAKTQLGDIEYAETGEGEAALVIHGAGGGYDQGLLIGRDLGEEFRIIAPSRFGYLKTPVPDDSSPAGQADAHAALLHFLDIDKALVMGASAGAPSAIELALRHPERVSALILLVPRAYDPANSVGVDQSAPSQAVLRLVESAADFPFWLAIQVARAAVVRFLGVPPEVEARASPTERARVTEIMRSILPLSSRIRGLEVENAIEIMPWPLERIKVPTLIISAKDDLFNTLPAARFTADHIPGAELRVLPEGGHLMVGQNELVRSWILDFLRKHRSTKRLHERKVVKVLETVS